MVLPKLPKIVQDWVDGDKSTPLTITTAHVQEWRSDEIGGFNRWLKQEVLGKSTTYEHKWDDITQLRTINYIAAGHVFSGTPDARQSTDSPAPDAGPFRRRCRKLGDSEMELHGRIKDKATELWALYDLMMTEKANANHGIWENGEQRDIAIAKTHLEDSVMRAVRALTA